MNFKHSIVLVVFFLLQGCSTLQEMMGSNKKPDEATTNVARTSTEFFAEKEKLDATFVLLDNGKYEDAVVGFKLFILNNPSSPYVIQATYGLALSYEGIEEWDAALTNFREITNRASSAGDHEVAAQSFYKMALCYERLGNNELALASLVDASNRAAYLPIEIGKAELPARMAVIYLKLNQVEIAEAYFQKAESGIQGIKRLKSATRDQNWLGKTLLKMGAVSLNQLSEETFVDSVMNLSRAQKYLIQAIEEADDQSAKTAESELKNEYSALAKFIENIQPVQTSDWQRTLREKTEKQHQMASQLLESSEKLKLILLPEEHPKFKKTSEIPVFLSQLEAKMVPFTYSHDLILPLTPEAEKLHSIKRQVRLLKIDQGISKENGISEGAPEGVPTALPKKKKKDPNL